MTDIDKIVQDLKDTQWKMADEIELLRTENEKLRNEVMSDYNEGWEEGISAMKAENERLRERLAEADESNRCVSDENEQLRKENGKLRDALAFIQCKAQDTVRPVPFQDDEE